MLSLMKHRFTRVVLKCGRPPLGYKAVSQTADLIKTTAVYSEIKRYLGLFFKILKGKKGRG